MFFEKTKNSRKGKGLAKEVKGSKRAFLRKKGGCEGG